MDLPFAPHAPIEPREGFWRWDEDRAQNAVNFIEGALTHTKGRHAGQPFILEGWQKAEIIRPMFGTMMLDSQYNEWVRQYRLCWIEMARKNGKSEIASALALYFLFADGEESAEVYCVAADKDQASLVFNVAKRMVELSPVLSPLIGSRIEIVDSRKRIIDKKTNGVLAVLPGDAGGALGTNPSAVIMDEVLTQRDRHLFDAMRQGFGTRKHPMMCCITTAAYTTAAFALEEHEYSQRVEANPNMDPARFTYLRNLPKEWDWQNEGEPPSAEHPNGTGWYYANPALGSFLNINNLRAEAEEAKDRPSSQNAFRVFRLNQWTSQANRWLDMGVWDENGRPGYTPAELRLKLAGRACYGGLDLASTSDFTAWVLIFPGSPSDPDADGFTVLPHFFIPRAAVQRRAPMQDKFASWEADGHITVIEGQTIDYDKIEDHIVADGEAFRIRSFGYDQWNATQVVYHLEDAGQVGVKVQQSATRLNDPCKRLESLLADRALYHAGNPVLRWMADNVELDITGDGLMRPSKAKSGEKIDGIVAVVNALFVANVPVEETHAVTFIRFNDDSGPIPGSDGLDDFLAAWRGSDDDDD